MDQSDHDSVLRPSQKKLLSIWLRILCFILMYPIVWALGFFIWFGILTQASHMTQDPCMGNVYWLSRIDISFYSSISNKSFIIQMISETESQWYCEVPINSPHEKYDVVWDSTSSIWGGLEGTAQINTYTLEITADGQTRPLTTESLSNLFFQEKLDTRDNDTVAALQYIVDMAKAAASANLPPPSHHGEFYYEEQLSTNFTHFRLGWSMSYVDLTITGIWTMLSFWIVFTYYINDSLFWPLRRRKLVKK